MDGDCCKIGDFSRAAAPTPHLIRVSLAPIKVTTTEETEEETELKSGWNLARSRCC